MSGGPKYGESKAVELTLSYWARKEHRRENLEILEFVRLRGCTVDGRRPFSVECGSDCKGIGMGMSDTVNK